MNKILLVITLIVLLSLALLGTMLDGPLNVDKVGTLGEWISGLGALSVLVYAINTDVNKKKYLELQKFNGNLKDLKGKIEHFKILKEIESLDKKMSLLDNKLEKEIKIAIDDINGINSEINLSTFSTEVFKSHHTKVMENLESENFEEINILLAFSNINIFNKNSELKIAECCKKDVIKISKS